jgi:hypothetical protein
VLVLEDEMRRSREAAAAMPSQVLQARLSELGAPGVVEVVMTDLRLKETAFGWIKLLQQGRLELPSHPPLLKQLRGLSFERLPAGGVRLSVPERLGHDDLAMALCLAATACLGNDLPPAPPDVVVDMADLDEDLGLHYTSDGREWSISPW